MSSIGLCTLALILSQAVAIAGDLGTLQYCCDLGYKKAAALNSMKCELNPEFPLKNVRFDEQHTCSSAMNICCLDYWRNKTCNDGKRAAKERGVCDKQLRTDADVSFKFCCEACKLGSTFGRMNDSCKLGNISSGSSWGDVFTSCCMDTASRKTDQASIENGNMCGVHSKELCSHECVPVPGSYRCKCRPGYSLMGDGKSCQENLIGCEELKICQQKCHYKGSSIVCSCKEGFQLQQDNTTCRDINECETTNPCYSSDEVCVNTLGGYNCNCAAGFQREQMTGACVDINECQVNSHNCDIYTQRCDNTIGSYHCVRSIGCGTGYTFNSETGDCEDDNECLLGVDNCRLYGLECKNTLGSFRCEKKPCDSGNCTRSASFLIQPNKQCSPGFEWNGKNNSCVDINECKKTTACKADLKCVNTVGSYQCISLISCGQGLRVNETTNQCSDIDECEEQPGICDHLCINVWGSFACSCALGFILHQDSRSCIDINECETSKGRLCADTCFNTPGSYRCQCPDGYQLDPDKANCRDINECAMAKDKCNQNDICFNIKGSHRCIAIECPENYEKEKNKKNLQMWRCKRAAYYCKYELSEECLQTPISYSFNYLSLPSNVSIPPSSRDLFSLQTPREGFSNIDLQLKTFIARSPSGVPRAGDDYFFLKRKTQNLTQVMMKKTILGPQEIELHLTMKLYANGTFVGFNLCKLFLFVSLYIF